MSNKPKEPPPKEPDSLEKLAEFTKAILRVPKDGLKPKRNSSGRKTAKTFRKPLAD